jgi:exonuclease SbcC
MLQLNDALEQLKIASQYVNLYEKIRDEIFWRDGALSMSLRSWAVKYISEKASEYIRLFGIGITSIQLQESEREVNILCYHPRGKVDVSSLSGGETVAIALAVRFAMANLMGKGRVDFLVLDEPTVHLDSERKRSLVELIRKISSSMESLSLKQLIVITHDEEIIENSEISSIFKFEVSTEGTVVSRM